ncbi:DUF4173 domain-containing protein [Methylopila sp. 73B]|uniref:DUF4153 domain-containing protein n=1 Tax=Methylopila sp. 73B TaxID=1120792 RepID=UPI001AEBEB16|nr:DUF4173 domain-containing protein [Methylopila sp. 73B]
MTAFGFAWAMVFALLEDPSPLAGLIFWCAIGLAALLPRAARFDDAWRWIGRLAAFTLSILVKPIEDGERWFKVRRRRRGLPFAKVALFLVAPLAGAVVFTGLFASANPIIARWIEGLRWGGDATDLSMRRVWWWIVIAFVVWSTLRASRFIRPRTVRLPTIALPGAPAISTASVIVSLVVFNAIFAIENVLDVVFLWSGAPLPDGVTLADYAHSGAYPLILTALLAGGFVLFVLRPGAPTEGGGPLRALVYVWIAQNIFLVASSMLRTVDYIEAYSLTRLRLAALIWMALVAAGLGLICWRIIANKSSAWLINANAAVLATTLVSCVFVSLGSVTAQWNVRHNATTSGSGGVLDVAYLEYLGPSALNAMLEFERAHPSDPLTEQVASARLRISETLAAAQSDWRSWTWRGARRLAVAHAADPGWSPAADGEAGD